MDKARDAFRTISEVSEWLDTPTYVLRFWESRFPQIKPVKRAGGRRYYRPEDMQLLGGIKKLLHFDGNTIKGVQTMIKEKGVKFVADLSPGLDEKIVSPENQQESANKAELESMVILKSDDAPEQKAEPLAGEPLKLQTEDSASEKTEEKVTVTVHKKTRIVRAEPAEDRPVEDVSIEEEAADTQAETALATEPSAEIDHVEPVETASAEPEVAEPVPESTQRVLSHSANAIHPGPFGIRPAKSYSPDDLQEIETLYYSLKMVRNNMRRIGSNA